MQKTVKRKGLILALIFLGLFPRFCFSSEPDVNEIKAAFVYNFLKFVEWPPEAWENRQTMVLYTIGDSEFAVKVKLIEGRTANHRQIVIKKAGKSETFADAHAVVVCSDNTQECRNFLQRIGDKPILTVSDGHDFIGHGGVIGLKMLNDKIRFDINLGAAKRSGLKISSQLLKLAAEVLK